MRVTTQIQELDGVVVVTVYGDLDVAGVRSFRSSMTDLLEVAAHGLVLSLDNVDYVDSMGIGALIGLQKLAVNNRKRFCLQCTNSLISRVLHISGLEDYFVVIENAHDGVSYVLNKGEE